MSVFIAEIQLLATDMHVPPTTFDMATDNVQHSKFRQQIYAHSPECADKSCKAG